MYLVSTVTHYLCCYCFQFFADYNSKLLESSNYITRRLAVKVRYEFVFDLNCNFLNCMTIEGSKQASRSLGIGSSPS